MRKFMKQLADDKELQKKFQAYMASEEAKARFAEVKEALNKAVIANMAGFAKEQGIKVERDPEFLEEVSLINRHIAKQLNEMADKQFSMLDQMRRGFR